MNMVLKFAVLLQIILTYKLVPAEYAYRHLGCYKDRSWSTVMDKRVYSGGLNTIEYCTSLCYDEGYRYAGVKDGEECWCDYSRYDQYGSGLFCNVVCPGNGSQICGGAYSINAYYIFSAPVRSTTTVSTTSVPSTTTQPQVSTTHLSTIAISTTTQPQVPTTHLSTIAPSKPRATSLQSPPVTAPVRSTTALPTTSVHLTTTQPEVPTTHLSTIAISTTTQPQVSTTSVPPTTTQPQVSTTHLSTIAPSKPRATSSQSPQGGGNHGLKKERTAIYATIIAGSLGICGAAVIVVALCRRRKQLDTSNSTSNMRAQTVHVYSVTVQGAPTVSTLPGNYCVSAPSCRDVCATVNKREQTPSSRFTV